jgi:hypothetical protein
MPKAFEKDGKIEKAHPAITPLLKPSKLTPLEHRARSLKAGARVLKHAVRHLAGKCSFDEIPDWWKPGHTSAILELRIAQSRIAAELHELHY